MEQSPESGTVHRKWNSSSGFYEVPCSCGLSYIGQTGRSITQCLSEHLRHFKQGNTNTSAIAEHAINCGHAILFDKTRILANDAFYFSRIMRGAFEIKKNCKNFNVNCNENRKP